MDGVSKEQPPLVGGGGRSGASGTSAASAATRRRCWSEEKAKTKTRKRKVLAPQKTS